MISSVCLLILIYKTQYLLQVSVIVLSISKIQTIVPLVVCDESLWFSFLFLMEVYETKGSDTVAACIELELSL